MAPAARHALYFLCVLAALVLALEAQVDPSLVAAVGEARYARDPDREAKAWLQKMAETDRMCGNYQEMVARSLISLEELEEKLGQLAETRATAEQNLAALEGRRERIEQLERDKDTLLESYAGMAPDALNSLTPEERRQVYKMLKLRVTAYPDARLEVGGVLTNATGVCSNVTPFA